MGLSARLNKRTGFFPLFRFLCSFLGFVGFFYGKLYN